MTKIELQFFGGRGASGLGGAGVLSKAERDKIINDVNTHTREQNEGALANLEKWRDREKKIIDNKENYIKTGYIKSEKDKWFKDHVDTYKALDAKYKTMKEAMSKQPAKTSYTTKQLNSMSRAKLVDTALKVAAKKAKSQGITEAEAVRRAKALMTSNSDAQLRKYIKRNG